MNERLEQAKLENECEAAAQLFVARSLAELALTIMASSGLLPTPVVLAAIDALIAGLRMTAGETQDASVLRIAQSYLERFRTNVAVPPPSSGMP